MKIALITGSAGLIGSEAARFFSEKGLTVVGVDNDISPSVLCWKLLTNAKGLQAIK